MIRKVFSLLLAAVLVGCKRQEPVPQKEILSHADYNEFFENSMVDGVFVEKIKLCDLKVKGNQIVTTDPLVVPDLKPLERKVSPGVYPVYLYLAKTEKSGDRIAIAVLQFTQEKAQKFQLATRQGEEIAELSKGGADFFGFSVDAGLGAFYDTTTATEYNSFIDSFYSKNQDANIYDDLLAPLFKANARNPSDPNDWGNWLCFTIPGTDGYTVAMFQSGYGDGVYPSYWGIDASGTVCNLVIDFHVLLLPK